MTGIENEKLVRRHIDGLNADTDFGWMDETLAPDCILHHPALPQPLQGVAPFKGFFQAVRGAFPDFHVALEDVVAAGDKIVVRGTCSGTFEGNFAGIAPTGKQTTWEAIGIYRIADGMIAEVWEQLDLLGAWQRLGVLPSMG